MRHTRRPSVRPKPWRDGMIRDDNKWRARVLAYDLDSDSKGDDGGMRKFRDEIVVARAPGPCCLCFGPVIPGSLSRRETAKFDGNVVSVLYCLECCDAMAAWPESDAIDGRYEIGRRRSEAMRHDA